MDIHDFVKCGGRPGGVARIEIHPATARHAVPDGRFMVVIVHSDADGGNEVREGTCITSTVMAEIGDMIATRARPHERSPT